MHVLCLLGVTHPRAHHAGEQRAKTALQLTGYFI
jgi:hypothetical protein